MPQFVRFDGKTWPPEWPQDTLAIPAGHGNMPATNPGNREVSRRESFTYSGQIAIPVSTPANTPFRLTIPTDQDADFWCNQIYFQGQRVDAGVASNSMPVGRIHIGDARTGEYLTWPAPGVSLSFFVGGSPAEELGFDVNLRTFPSGFRSTGTLIQPFCFTRTGAILIEYLQRTATSAVQSHDLSIVFGGWKEYVYASE